MRSLHEYEKRSFLHLYSTHSELDSKKFLDCKELSRLKFLICCNRIAHQKSFFFGVIIGLFMKPTQPLCSVLLWRIKEKNIDIQMIISTIFAFVA